MKYKHSVQSMPGYPRSCRADLMPVSMKSRSACGLAMLIALMVVVGGCSLVWTTADVVLFSTPEWSANGFVYIRTDKDDRLPLKLEPLGATYRYDRVGNRIDRVPDSVWALASDPTSDCSSQRSVTRRPASLHPGHSLTVGDREVDTEGMTPLLLQLAPSKTKAAVVSAAGPFTQIHMLGQRGAIGQFYHEVFSHPDYRLLQQAVRIPIGSKNLIPQACWTPGEKEVVYFDAAHTQLCIVPVEGDP